MKLLTIALFFILTLSAQTYGSKGAHIHGVAYLNVILDTDRINIELFSPAMAFIGFEHKPETESEKDAVISAKQALSKGDIFSFFEKCI